MPECKQYTLSILIDGDGYVKNTITNEITTGEIVNPGESVELRAVPRKGSSFDYWSGDVDSFAKSISVYMSSNKTVTAHFASSVPEPQKKCEAITHIPEASDYPCAFICSSDKGHTERHKAEGTLPTPWTLTWE